MKKISKKISNNLGICALIASGTFLYTPSVLSIPITFTVASDGNTPEAAVANALRNPNNTGVCGTIRATTNPSSDQLHMLTLCDALDAVTEAQTGPAYTALSARSITSLTSFTANSFISSMNIGDIAKRLAALRRSAANSTKLNTASLNSGTPLSDMAALYANGRTGGGASADTAPTKNTSENDDGGLNDNRLSAYISASTSDADQTETSTLAGYESSVASFLVGLDYRFSHNMFAGMAIKTLSGDIDLDKNTGTVDVTNNSLSLYASYYPSENTYLQTALTAGQGSFDITRRMDFTLNNIAFSEIAKSSPDGSGYSFNLSGGYDYYFTGTGISTVTDITLGYASADIDEFDESGAQGFNLTVAEQSIESMTSKVGIQISKSISTPFGVILPEFGASWTHEFKADGEDIVAAFTIDPANAFRFTTDERDSDFFVLSLATSVILSHGVMGYIQYEKVFDITDYDVGTLNIGARIEF
ncbi:MAG TPA: autotransporter outer membrane beta-barrel domain-containing protein [Gammaproteobacteria bacterium]|nr:autotransporter outer membrane beta-barrel domain-containing protein [Gammaproteobacteria bacterium]